VIHTRRGQKTNQLFHVQGPLAIVPKHTGERLDSVPGSPKVDLLSQPEKENSKSHPGRTVCLYALKNSLITNLKMSESS
jgi:hypothetical protein